MKQYLQLSGLIAPFSFARAFYDSKQSKSDFHSFLIAKNIPESGDCRQWVLPTPVFCLPSIQMRFWSEYSEITICITVQKFRWKIVLPQDRRVRNPILFAVT
jgi:hypothetical protein